MGAFFYRSFVLLPIIILADSSAEWQNYRRGRPAATSAMPGNNNSKAEQTEIPSAPTAN
jgi:hypothetical protein